MLVQLHPKHQFGAFINNKVTFSTSTLLVSALFVLKEKKLNFTPFWFRK